MADTPRTGSEFTSIQRPANNVLGKQFAPFVNRFSQISRSQHDPSSLSSMRSSRRMIESGTSKFLPSEEDQATPKLGEPPESSDLASFAALTSIKGPFVSQIGRGDESSVRVNEVTVGAGRDGPGFLEDRELYESAGKDLQFVSLSEAKVKGFVFSDILSGFSGGIKLLYINNRHPERIRKVFLVKSTKGKMIVKQLRYKKADNVALESMLNEREICLEFAADRIRMKEEQKRNTYFAEVLDFGQHFEGDYASIEILFAYGGKNLAQRMKAKKAVHDDTIADWIFQSAEAMAKLHQKGIYHSDLKPSNIIYSKGQLKIIGLGSVCDKFRSSNTHKDFLKSLSVSMKSCMKEVFPSYVPPEFSVQGGYRSFSLEKMDVYCWGMTMYQLVSRCSDEALAGICKKICTSPAEYNAFIKSIEKLKLRGVPEQQAKTSKAAIMYSLLYHSLCRHSFEDIVKSFKTSVPLEVNYLLPTKGSCITIEVKVSILIVLLLALALLVVIFVAWLIRSHRDHWQLLWYDEFDNSTNFDTHWEGFSAQTYYYSNNGSLVVLYVETGSSTSSTTATIRSKETGIETGRGKVEARIRFWRYEGVKASFGVFATNGSETACNNSAYVREVGDEDTSQFWLDYCYGGKKDCKESYNYTVTEESLYGAYNVFTIDFGEDSVAFGINYREVFSRESSELPSDYTWNFGGNSSAIEFHVTSTPSEKLGSTGNVTVMEIDYVKVYAWNQGLTD